MTNEPPAVYTLHFINDSRNSWTFCVFLKPPPANVPDVKALAWLTVQVAATTRVSLRWALDYGFTWLQTGTMSRGMVQVTASQCWAADLDLNNQITYTTRHGLPTFASQGEGPSSGSLYIRQDRRVAGGKSMVGVSVSGSPAFTAVAQPNINLIFTPVPEYWIAFGKFEQGQVLDMSEVTNTAPVVFAPNSYSMTARLSPDNLWSVESHEHP